MQDPTPSQLRRSGAIRVTVSVAIAAAVSALLAVALWVRLDVTTNIVGFPIFADFNPYNYFRLYFIGVLLFPLLAALLFLGLTRLGPRFGLPAPLPRGSLRRGVLPPPSDPEPDGDPPLAAAGLAKRRAVAVARVTLVGLVLGLEAGIATNHLWRGLILGVAIYALAVAVAATVLERRAPGGSSLEDRLAAVNAVGAALSVAGLIAVSANTEVTVIADGSVKHYPWFPAWIGVPVAAALVAAVVVGLRKARWSAAKVELWAMTLIAAPIAFFLLSASLPGDLPSVDTFEVGQPLVASRLVGEGWLPWRDVLTAHGLLFDVVNPAINLAVFGDSAWGLQAGNSMLAGPLYFISTYFLLAYLFRRNLSFLLLFVLISLGTVFAAPDYRLILWPLILLLLAAVLERPSAVRAAGLGLAVVAQTIVTPEAAPALPAVALILVAYEWCSRSPGTSFTSAFRRCLWFAGAGAALGIAFGVYMASRGAFDDYIYLTINLIRGHVLLGAIAPNPGHESQFEVLALAPPIGLLISIAYVIVRVRLRRGFPIADWVMGAAALFALAYYSKFLSRMDTGHAYQPFQLTLPLLLYIVYRGVTASEAWIRNRWPANRALRLSAHPLSIGLIVVLLAITWGKQRDRFENVDAAYRPAVAAQPEFKRVGYTQAFDAAAYRDLRRIIGAYLDPNDRLYDFTDEPGLFFYFLDRNPSIRYFLSASVVDIPELQEDTIRRLRKSPPKLIVFDSDNVGFTGLSNMDGVPTMVRLYEVSRWILDRYRPLLWTRGFTIYARRDMPPLSEVDLHLSRPPLTQGVAYSVQPCAWGSAPTFLSPPAEPEPGAGGVGAQARTAPNQVFLDGWAGDPAAKAPAREVIVTVGDKIVGRTKPKLSRPDLVAYGLPEGFRRAGFQMQVPGETPGKPGRLHVFGVSRDGRLTELVAEGQKPAKGTIDIDGREVTLDPKAVYGQINNTVRTRAMQISLPPGSHWTDYRWLEIDAGKNGFTPADFTVYDRQTRPSAGREITFRTIDGSPDRYIVPVDSCTQWHAYHGRRLFLNFTNPQDISAVRLIR